MGVLNLVHEMLHSFGAKHDPDPSQNPQCTPKDKVTSTYFNNYIELFFNTYLI